MSRFPLAVALAVPLLVLSPVALAATHAVDIEDFLYDPDPLSANAGDVVTWTNRDTAPHTVTCDIAFCSEDELGSPTLGLDDTYTAPVLRAGTYSYFCAVHSSMTGRVYVGSGNAADGNLAPEASSIAVARPALLPGLPIPDPARAVVSVVVENRGGAATSPVTVEFLAPDAAGGLAVIGTATLPGLAAGEAATASAAWNGAPLFGTSDVTVRVDVANAAVEGDERDNVATSTVAAGLIAI